MSLKLKQKIVGLALVSALLPIVFTYVIFLVGFSRVEQIVTDQLAIGAQAECANIVHSLCVGLDKAVQADVLAQMESVVITKRGRVLVFNEDGAAVRSAKQEDSSVSRERQYLLPLVRRARNASVGEVVRDSVVIPPEVDGGPDKHVYAAALYFAPWKWVVVAIADRADYLESAGKTEQAIHDLALSTLAGTIFVLAMSIAAAFYLAGRIAQPIVRLTEVAQCIAQGNLVQADILAAKVDREIYHQASMIDTDSQCAAYIARLDETGKLLSANICMIHQLRTLVGKVQRSSIDLLTSATEITATSKNQQAASSTLGASTHQIATAVKEISATSQELVRTMEDVTQLSSEAARLAESGRDSLGGMERTIRRLADSTRMISSKLTVISERAADINVVVDTINKVADQTNLLSVNAAIEAEKAGETGLGFGVVAGEIRRLADQTAVSTLEIEQMVSEMHTAVSAGVDEMDKFTDEVRESVDEVRKIGGDIAQVIETVRALTPRFESVNEGMRSQSQGAQHINGAMTQLTDTARRAATSVTEFHGAADHLQKAVVVLQDEVARFRVEENTPNGDETIADLDDSGNPNVRDVFFNSEDTIIT